MAVTSRAIVRPHSDQASHPMRRVLTGSSCCSFRLSTRFPHDRLGTVTDDARRAPGGEQAANTLQPDSSSRHATTANVEVGSAIAASVLVNGSTCLRSHSSGPCLEMAPGWRDFHRQPDPGAVDYQSGETPVGESGPAIPVVPAKILGPRVGGCLRWP